MMDFPEEFNESKFNPGSNAEQEEEAKAEEEKKAEET